jgi:hypothetical protein
MRGGLSLPKRRERGHEHLLVDANDEDLEGKLLGVLERLGKALIRAREPA